MRPKDNRGGPTLDKLLATMIVQLRELTTIARAIQAAVARLEQRSGPSGAARARGIEAYVMHPSSIAVSREHRRAKSDRLDQGQLKRALLGWLRGEKRHCSMAAIPTLEQEDAKRPNREREYLVDKRTGIIKRMKAAFVHLGKTGNARARGAMIQLAWRFLIHQKDSTPTQWYQARVASGKKRKTMIVALARKLLIALWRFITSGEVPQGIVLRSAS